MSKGHSAPSSLWGLEIPSATLNKVECEFLANAPSKCPDIQWLWSEMDRAWDEIGLSRGKPNPQSLNKFYGHPVWLLNGIYSEKDPVSESHRIAIGKYVKNLSAKPMNILDFGGGFGSLARKISIHAPTSQVHIAEPYPRPMAAQLNSGFNNIEYIKRPAEEYDVVLAQDVLEHVESPYELAVELASHTKKGGYIIFANCFYPVIKCHLPETFYLRHTFSFTMKALGLRYIGTITGCEHAQVFQRNNELAKGRGHIANLLSKLGGPIINSVIENLRKVKSALTRKNLNHA